MVGGPSELKAELCAAKAVEQSVELSDTYYGWFGVEWLAALTKLVEAKQRAKPENLLPAERTAALEDLDYLRQLVVAIKSPQEMPPRRGNGRRQRTCMPCAHAKKGATREWVAPQSSSAMVRSRRATGGRR